MLVAETHENTGYYTNTEHLSNGNEGGGQGEGGWGCWGSTCINEIEEVRKFHLRLAWDPTANNSRMSKQMMEQALSLSAVLSLSLSSPSQRELFPFSTWVIRSLATNSNCNSRSLSHSLSLLLSSALPLLRSRCTHTHDLVVGNCSA